MSDEIKKSDYGPKGAGLYDKHVNQERKASNTGDRVEGNGKNVNVKSYSTKAGQLSAKQQAAAENAKSRVKALSGPVKATWTPEELEQMNIMYGRGVKKDEDMDEDMLEVEADGKQELVEGKEPLKKDPKKRWSALKKAIHHDKAFMSLEEQLASDKADGDEEQPPAAEQQGQQEGQSDAAPQEGEPNDAPANSDEGEQEESPDGDDSGDQQPDETEAAQGDDGSEAPSDDQGQDKPLEAVSAGQEDEQPDDAEAGNGDLSADQQELADALKDEGYSDQEIAYIVHGHHAPEVDPSKQAKAHAIGAMSDLDLNNATQMAQIEQEHTKRTKDHEHEHSRRMADLEHQNAQKKGSLVDIDVKHRQRLLDLEFETAKKQKQMELEHAMKQKDAELQNSRASAPDAESDRASKRELQQIEVQKKKLELKIKEEEMKLELEFKRREHELKLKLMEQQMKVQAQQKNEIGGIKHEQRLQEAKNPPPIESVGKKTTKGK